MKKILSLGLFILSLVAFMQPVYADSVIKDLPLPLVCDRTKGIYSEMTTLVIVPLDAMVAKDPGQSDQDLVRGIFYDFAYARGNKGSPLNAVSVNGTIYALNCNFADYSANVVTGLSQSQGVFTLGVIGTLPVKDVQSLIDTYKFKSFMQSSFAVITDNKNTTIGFANLKTCAVCQGLVPAKGGVADRAYAITVSDVSVSKSVRQREQVAFSMKIKNTGIFPLYSTGIAPLRLVSLSKGISPVYNSSWVSLSEIARIETTLLPDGETTLAVTLSAPLLPGTYKDTFAIKVGNKMIDKKIPVTFTVEKDNLTLGKIISKDGSPFANFHSTPNLKGPVIGRLDVGTYVIIQKYQDAWVKIETKEGKVGWVYKPFIRAI